MAINHKRLCTDGNNNVLIKEIIAGLIQPEWVQTTLICRQRVLSGTLGHLCLARPRAPQHAPRPGGPREHGVWTNGRDAKGHHGIYGKGPLEAV